MHFITSNIQQLMESKNMSISEFARVTGIDKSTISRWLSTDITPRQDMIKRISQKLDVPFHFFYEENFMQKYARKGENWVKRETGEQSVFDVAAGQGRINDSHATEYERIEDEEEMEDGYTWCSVHGDSMLPELRDGDRIKVKHQTETAPHDLTVVQIDGDECTVKYVEITETGVWLRASNKDVFEDRCYSVHEVMTLPIKIIGKVVEVRRRY